jgi:hypothetical protein
MVSLYFIQSNQITNAAALHQIFVRQIHVIRVPMLNPNPLVVPDKN